MTKQLPASPNIRHLKNQSKQLLKLWLAFDPASLAQLRLLHPSFQNLTPDQLVSKMSLHNAQHSVAQSYGFRDWFHLSGSTALAHNSAMTLSAALDDPRMDDLEYRTRVAQSKGLPAIDASRMSDHGVRYEVVDYMPAISCEGAARVRKGGPQAHINDLLPIIAFPEMSERLYELYLETDCVATKPLIFFDTMPDMHPSTAAPGLNQVVVPAAETPLYFHFDAARIHETIIAHELGHIWVEMVDGCEDYRHPRDQSDFPPYSKV